MISESNLPSIMVGYLYYIRVIVGCAQIWALNPLGMAWALGLVAPRPWIRTKGVINTPSFF